jgi:hypothetical protein
VQIREGQPRPCSSRLQQPTYLETSMVSSSEAFGTLGRMGECTVARGVDNWQLGERELGYGSRKNRSDQPELQSESHGASFCLGTGEIAFGEGEEGKRTDEKGGVVSFVR